MKQRITKAETTTRKRPRRAAQSSRPLLTRMRRRQNWLRAIAVIVATAFLNLYLQPLALATQLPAPPAPQEPGDSEKLARTIDTIENRLEKLEDKLSKNEDATDDRDAITTLRQDLDTLDTQALADFAAIEQHIKDKNLPAVILERHTQAVNTYKQEMQTLKANLDALNSAPDNDTRRLKARAAKEHIKAKQKHRTHTPIDPNNLPFRVPDGKVREPKRT